MVRMQVGGIQELPRPGLAYSPPALVLSCRDSDGYVPNKPHEPPLPFSAPIQWPDSRCSSSPSSARQQRPGLRTAPWPSRCFGGGGWMPRLTPCLSPGCRRRLALPPVSGSSPWVDGVVHADRQSRQVLATPTAESAALRARTAALKTRLVAPTSSHLPALAFPQSRPPQLSSSRSGPPGLPAPPALHGQQPPCAPAPRQTHRPMVYYLATGPEHAAAPHQHRPQGAAHHPVPPSSAGASWPGQA